DFVFDAGRLQFFFRFTDGGDFGVRVDDVRDDVVIHVAPLAGDDLGDGDALFFRLVREHRTGGDVAEDVDAVSGFQVTVMRDEAALIGFDANAFEAEVLREWTTADGDEDDVGVQRAGGAAF